MDNTIYQVIVGRALTDDHHSLALTAGGDGYVYQAILDYNRDDQQWVITTERDNTFSIYSKTQRKYVARQENVNALILVDRNMVDNGVWALWRNEGDTNGFHPINSLSDWEQKINMLGNGPYVPGKIVFTWKWSGGADNENWRILPVINNVSMKSISFNLDAGTIDDETPMVAGRQIVSNPTDQPITQTLHFTFIESHQYSFTKEQGLKVTEGIEFSAGLPIVGESKVKISVEGTWKFSETTQNEDENEVSLDVAVTVPPHRAMEVSTLVLRGSLDVPFIATVTYTHPDGSTSDVQTSGLFSGVNGYTVTTSQRDLGVMTHVERRPFNRLGATRASSNGSVKKELIHSN